MIREAMQFIAEMSNGAILKHGVQAYSKHELVSLPSPAPLADHVILHTLSGLADYVQEDFDKVCEYGVFIDGPGLVSLCSRLTEDFRQREVVAKCVPFDTKAFPFGRFVEPEDFVIALQACFVPDETTAAVLRVVGNVQSEAVETLTDDGVSQMVAARTGIARINNVSVPNPVTLRPYRTFQEIEQPASRYVLRLKRDGEGMPSAALFEHDDGQWRLAATEAIKVYLAGRELEIPIFA